MYYIDLLLETVLAKKLHPRYLGYCVILMAASFSSFANMVNQANADVIKETTLNNASQSIEWFKYSQGMARWMWFDVYQATLLLEQKNAYKNYTVDELLSEKMPLKLELCYQREVTPKQFIEGANHVLPSELPERLQQQVNQLHSHYQTVNKGDCYALVYSAKEQTTQLNLNGQTVFSTDVPGFKSLYFGIWLGQNPLSISLKEALLKEG